MKFDIVLKIWTALLRVRTLYTSGSTMSFSSWGNITGATWGIWVSDTSWQNSKGIFLSLAVKLHVAMPTNLSVLSCCHEWGWRWRTRVPAWAAQTGLPSFQASPSVLSLRWHMQLYFELYCVHQLNLMGGVSLHLLSPATCMYMYIKWSPCRYRCMYMYMYNIIVYPLKSWP